MLMTDSAAASPRSSGSLFSTTLPGMLLALSAAILLGLPLSLNSGLWLAGLLALLSAVWLVGWRSSYPVLPWVIAWTWLPIAADLLNADLAGTALADTVYASYRTEAVLTSFGAVVTLALGMRIGIGLLAWLAPHTAEPRGSERIINVRAAATAFFAGYPFALALGALALAAPSLRQPLLAFVALKFVCLYLIAATAIESGRGYSFLALAVGIEVVTGITGYFSIYTDAIFIVILALAGSRKRLTTQMLALGALATVLLLWLTLVWTAIKPEYRYWVSGYSLAQVVVRPFDERVKFIATRIFDGSIDYEATYLKLLQRIGYTHYYAQVISRQDAGLIDMPSRYLAAIEHVFMPRVLFPDKAPLDDSALTSILTGQEISQGTSIGVGFVTEAHIDFGFPGMLAAILVLGTMMGAGAQYFMTRPAPLVIREAFTAVSLFSAFRYEWNIDKALGGYVLGFIALALALKFGYPILANWLTRPAPLRSRAEIAA